MPLNEKIAGYPTSQTLTWVQYHIRSDQYFNLDLSRFDPWNWMNTSSHGTHRTFIVLFSVFHWSSPSRVFCPSVPLFCASVFCRPRVVFRVVSLNTGIQLRVMGFHSSAVGTSFGGPKFVEGPSSSQDALLEIRTARDKVGTITIFTKNV